MSLKINYIAQLSPFVHSGGGELILRTLLQTGARRGHSFAFTTASPRSTDLFPNPNLTILADVFNSPCAMRRLDPKLLEAVADSRRFIHFDNAYVDACNLDYLPCSGVHNAECPFKTALPIYRRILSRDLSKNCFRQRSIVRKLYHQSLFNVFLSPLHHEVISSMLGLADRRHFILKPLIDEALFYNMGMERDLEYLFVGVISEAKGLVEMRRQFGAQEIHFIGKIAKGEHLGFGHYLGPVPYEQVPLYMNRARHFVFLPRWPEPQGRVVVEAAMCGCRIIANGNVGALSFNFDLACPGNYRKADTEFWDEVERQVREGAP